LEWTNGEATCGRWALRVLEVPSGWLWTLSYFDGESRILLDGSYGENGEEAPLATEGEARLAAEAALRIAAVNILDRLGLGAGQMEQLGVRRRLTQPTSAGEIAIEDLLANTREVIEAVGPLRIEGRVKGVRETKTRNVYFTLLDDHGCALPCRIASTTAKALARPLDGGRVRLRGVPTLFARRAEMQFDVMEMEVAS
jgi:hypothetical protein